MSNNEWFTTMRRHSMKLTIDGMVPILSLLSLIDCFVPALRLPYQCVVVFCLLSFSSSFKSIVSNPLEIPRRLLTYVLGETALLALTARLNQAATWIAEGFLVSSRQAYSQKRVFDLASDTWKVIIAISWLPVFYTSVMSNVFGIAIVEATVVILDDWHTLLNTVDPKSDADVTWKVRVLRPVKEVWHWLTKQEWVARLALILFCRFVLGGPPWLYAAGFRLLCLTMTVSQPTFVSCSIWFLFEASCYLYGRRLLPFMYLDRLVVLIPGMLPWQNNFVTSDGKLALLGRVRYNLLPSRVLFGALGATMLQIRMKQKLAAVRFRDIIGRVRTNNESNESRPVHEPQFDEEMIRSYSYMYLSFRISWHAMALLHMFECGPGHGTSWVSWLFRFAFGISIRLIVINSHLSFGGWRLQRASIP